MCVNILSQSCGNPVEMIPPPLPQGEDPYINFAVSHLTRGCYKNTLLAMEQAGKKKNT